MRPSPPCAYGKPPFADRPHLRGGSGSGRVHAGRTPFCSTRPRRGHRVLQAGPTAAHACHQALTEAGERGRFIAAEGAGHNIFETEPELVLETIDEILEATKPG